MMALFVLLLAIVLLHTITAVRGIIVIKSVTLNRGNSNIDRWILINGNLVFQDRVEAHNPFPITLKFGQTAAFQSCCDAIEIKVETDIGPQTLVWRHGKPDAEDRDAGIELGLARGGG